MNINKLTLTEILEYVFKNFKELHIATELGYVYRKHLNGYGLQSIAELPEKYSTQYFKKFHDAVKQTFDHFGQVK